MFISLLANTVIGVQLPRIQIFTLVVHTLGFFAMMIPLVSLSSHNSASDVFTSFINDGGWSNQGQSFFIGLIATAFAFLGKLPKFLLQGDS